jgi:DNA ligase (NAD+)
VTGERWGDSYATAVGGLAEAGFATARGVCGLEAVSVTELAVVWSTIEALAAGRGELGFDIDGAVVKVDAAALRDRAGATGRAPRWAIAYKYPADTRLTRLVDIIVDLGRTGRATPVAVLEPVSVGGVTIERATLHNAAEVARRDLRIGDMVWVRRAGEVIPEVVGPQLETRASDAEPWVMATTCPRCGAELDRSQQVWRCANRACGLAEQIEYFASRKALDIEGLGESLVAQLVERGLVGDVADVFALSLDGLVGLDRMAETSARKLLAQIEGAKAQPLSRLLTGLGIRLTGERVCRRLAEHFTTLAAVRAASIEELAAVEGIGTVRATQIAGELVELAPIIDRLVAAGCRTDEPTVVRASEGPLVGKKVCVTGSLPGLSRDEAQALVVALGGSPVSSVSKNTDLLVAGEKAGSKLAKAESLGIEVMDGAAFAALAGN